MPKSAPHAYQNLVLPVTLVILCFIAPSIAAYKCSGREYPNIFAINLSPEYSSVSMMYEENISRSSFNWRCTSSNSYGSETILKDSLIEGQSKMIQIRLLQNPPPSHNKHVERNGYIPDDHLIEVLRELKWTTKEWFEEESEFAVVAVPHYWYNPAELDFIKGAAETVGLNIVKFIKTHHAAATGLQFNQWATHKENILVYELGRDNYEVSVVEVNAGAVNTIASQRRAHLDRLMRQYGGFNADDERAEIMEMIYKKTHDYVDRVIGTANLTKGDISHAVMTGPHSHYTLARSLLEEYFTRNSSSTSSVQYHILDYSYDAATVGAAAEALVLAGRECTEVQYCH